MAPSPLTILILFLSVSYIAAHQEEIRQLQLSAYENAIAYLDSPAPQVIIVDVNTDLPDLAPHTHLPAQAAWLEPRIYIVDVNDDTPLLDN